MFNSDAKSHSAQPKPGPAPMTAPAPVARSTPSPFEPAKAASSGTSVIGTDLTILGDRITIISANKLQVDGDVRGNVHGKQVVITEEGSVVGMVCAEFHRSTRRCARVHSCGQCEASGDGSG